MTLKQLFKYRIYWMGIAMLWIVFAHSKISCGSFLAMVKGIGYGGVDIFLFASGIGNYFSYLRDCSPLDFIKRRIKRLAPAYLPFILVWLFTNILLHKISPFSIIGNFFAVQGFTSNGDAFNWYITGIALCYLLTPYFATLAKNNSRKQNILFIISLLLISFAFWNDYAMIISISRLPIYYIGMLFAKNNNKQLSKKNVVVLFGLFVFGLVSLLLSVIYFEKMLWNYGLYWYPFILITPFLCVLVSFVINFIEKKKTLLKICTPILKLFQIMGEYSFEIYLWHIFIFDMGEILLEKLQIGHKSLFFVGFSILSVLIAVCYNKLINTCKKAFVAGG